MTLLTPYSPSICTEDAMLCRYQNRIAPQQGRSQELLGGGGHNSETSGVGTTLGRDLLGEIRGNLEEALRLYQFHNRIHQ